MAEGNAERTQTGQADLESPAVEHGLRLALVAVGVILATLLEMIDTTIVNVALPNIQGNLGATIDEGAYIVTGYIIANVIVVPLTPWLQARFGLKRYYLASILIFTGASVMCGLSGAFSELVLWRIVQGLGGGLISTSQTILRDTFPRDKQGAAQGIFAGGVIIGPTLGPLIGGYITDNLDWRWCFFVNVPVAIVAVLLLVSFLREIEQPRRMPVDGVGLALLATSLGSMQFVLDQGQRKDWFSDDAIRTFSVLAVAGIVTFVAWELRARTPIVDLRVLRYPGVWAGSLLGGALGLALFGSLVILPQYTQNLLGFTALLSGQLISVRAVAMALLLPVGARLASGGHVDPRWQRHRDGAAGLLEPHAGFSDDVRYAVRRADAVAHRRRARTLPSVRSAPACHFRGPAAIRRAEGGLVLQPRSPTGWQHRDGPLGNAARSRNGATPKCTRRQLESRVSGREEFLASAWRCDPTNPK